MGMCETLWEPNMKPDQLFECISQVEWSSLIISFKTLTWIQAISQVTTHDLGSFNIFPHGQNVFFHGPMTL